MVAAIAIVVQRRSSSEHEQAQALLAQQAVDAQWRASRDQRYWERQVELYLAVIKVISINHSRDVSNETHDADLQKATAKQLEELSDLYPALAAFASAEVMDCFDAYWNACQLFVGAKPGGPQHTAWATESHNFKQTVIRAIRDPNHADLSETRLSAAGMCPRLVVEPHRPDRHRERTGRSRRKDAAR